MVRQDVECQDLFINFSFNIIKLCLILAILLTLWEAPPPPPPRLATRGRGVGGLGSSSNNSHLYFTLSEVFSHPLFHLGPSEGGKQG